MPIAPDVYQSKRSVDDALFARVVRTASFRLIETAGWMRYLRRLHP